MENEMFGILVSIENIFDDGLNLLTYIIIRIWIKIHLQNKILMCLLTVLHLTHII